MAEQVVIPGSLSEASSLLTARPVGLVPFQIRGQVLALQGAEAGIDAAVPVVADYFVGAVLDLPSADVPVTVRMLDDWGVDMEAVVAEAARNRAQVEDSVDAFEEALVISGVSFAAAALLCSCRRRIRRTHPDWSPSRSTGARRSRRSLRANCSTRGRAAQRKRERPQR